MANIQFSRVRVFTPIFLSIIIIILNPEELRDAIKRCVIPIEVISAKIKGSGAILSESVKDNIKLSLEKKELEKQISLLSFQYAKHKELFLENERLREILKYKEKTKFNIIIGKILGHDPSPLSSTIVIDRGSDDGVKKKQGVISLIDGRNVFIGRMIDVFPQSSIVLLTTDPGLSLPVRLEVSRTRGLLVGKKHGMELKFIPSQLDILDKEPIVTLAGTYIPEGLLIGHVESLSPKRRGLFRKIAVKPAFSPYKLEEVLIFVSN